MIVFRNIPRRGPRLQLPFSSVDTFKDVGTSSLRLPFETRGKRQNGFHQSSIAQGCLEGGRAISLDLSKKTIHFVGLDATGHLLARG